MQNTNSQKAEADGAVSDKSVQIIGARTHNLKNISVEIPRDQVVVITGLSGSGKSSLAFDTLYAEGQRQYVESLSIFSRQFLGWSGFRLSLQISPACGCEKVTIAKHQSSAFVRL